VPRLKPIDRVRRICLGLPQATEKLAWSEPTFRTGDGGKVFVMFANNHHNDGRIAIWCNAAPGTQDLLVRANPDRFFVPPYMGPRGWIGVRLEDGIADWAEIAEVIEEAYRVTAPKRLLARLPAE
jgi:hypothetical protein